MTTARNLITASLKKIGALAAGETPSSSEENDAFAELNRMLASWNTKNLLVFGVTIESFSTVASQNSYTLGDGGNWDTDRPVKTDEAFVKDSLNNEYPIEIIDNKRWGDIKLKSNESSLPTFLYIDDNYPLKTAYLYPTPSEVVTVILHNYRQISAIATLATTLQFPPGYEDAILYNLALRLCPDYGKAAPSEIAKYATECLSNIKRANTRNIEIAVDSALIKNSGYNITTGELI